MCLFIPLFLFSLQLSVSVSVRSTMSVDVSTVVVVVVLEVSYYLDVSRYDELQESYFIRKLN